MSREEAPVDSEFLRYVSGSLYEGEIVDGAAFKCRPADDGELSVHRRGDFSTDDAEDLNRLRAVVSQWMTIRQSGRFAQISRSDVALCAEEAGREFSYWRDPLTDLQLPDNPAHCVIVGVPDTDDDAAVALRDMIAIKVSRLHDALNPA